MSLLEKSVTALSVYYTDQPHPPCLTTLSIKLKFIIDRRNLFVLLSIHTYSFTITHIIEIHGVYK